MSMGRPAAAYPDQDHVSHIKIHLMYAADPNYGGSPLIGPQFAPHALEHIKQHLTLHYLQSMRAYVAEATGGTDTLKLHEERPLDVESQKALSLAAEMVNQDAQTVFQTAQPAIQALVQKVQQAQQSQREQAMNSDPTAQVILKTQMAETERKAKESQAKMQLDVQKIQQEYQVKMADMERKVQELIAKYDTQTKIDANRNATQIALANINNSADERIASINHGAAFDQLQMQLEHEQNQSAVEAINAADADIRNHGLQVQQQAMQAQAQQVQSQIDHQQALEQGDQQHQQALMQGDQQHQQALMQGDQQHQQALQQGSQQALTQSGLSTQQHQQNLEQQAAQPQQPPTGE